MKPKSNNSAKLVINVIKTNLNFGKCQCFPGNVQIKQMGAFQFAKFKNLRDCKEFVRKNKTDIEYTIKDIVNYNCSSSKQSSSQSGED